MRNICICICMHFKHTHKLINRFFKADWKITLQPKSWDSARGSSVCDPAWGSFRRFSLRIIFQYASLRFNLKIQLENRLQALFPQQASWRNRLTTQQKINLQEDPARGSHLKNKV
jgi:hypothetical protein